MRRQRIMTAAAGLVLAAMAGAAARAEDGRIAIELPADVRATFLEHMRTHMVSLDSVIQLLAAGKPKEAGRVARAEMAIGQGLGIGRHMPREFREMGFSFHRAADDFARVTTEVGEPPAADAWPKIMGGLAQITQQCNGCHGAFRVK